MPDTAAANLGRLTPIVAWRSHQRGFRHLVLPQRALAYVGSSRPHNMLDLGTGLQHECRSVTLPPIGERLV